MELTRLWRRPLFVRSKHGNMPMSTTAKRRWPRFALSTLFVIVALFGIWLAWNVRAVHERRALVHALEARGGKALLFSDVEKQTPGVSALMDSPRWKIPLIRRALGDERYLAIVLPEHSFTTDEVRHYFRAFREASVSVERNGGLFPVHDE